MNLFVQILYCQYVSASQARQTKFFTVKFFFMFSNVFLSDLCQNLWSHVFHKGCTNWKSVCILALHCSFCCHDKALDTLEIKFRIGFDSIRWCPRMTIWLGGFLKSRVASNIFWKSWKDLYRMVRKLNFLWKCSPDIDLFEGKQLQCFALKVYYVWRDLQWVKGGKHIIHLLTFLSNFT